MRIFARHSLSIGRTRRDEPSLLLEGDWPDDEQASNRWSLDESIDARQSWIDVEASRLAEAACGDPDDWPRFDAQGLAWLNALALRYYFVRLLRPVAFFQADAAPRPRHVTLHATPGRDNDYAIVLAAIGERAGFEIHLVSQSPNQASGGRKPPVSRNFLVAPNPLWRRAAGRLAEHLLPAAVDDRDRSPRECVILCGNRRILDPACRDALDRGNRVWWLYDRFAVGTAWRWGRRGIGQLICDASLGRENRFDPISRPLPPLVSRGIDLGPAAWLWLARIADRQGARQTRLVEQIERHVAGVRPMALILDEDATPVARAAIASARRRGMLTAVVQHGAPYVRFGFAPAAADTLRVWNEPTRRRLMEWGIPPERISIAGMQTEGRSFLGGRDTKGGRGSRRAGISHNHPSRTSPPPPPTILLLATTPARDDRPDSVEFHLTSRTHEEMLTMAIAAAADLSGTRLIVKQHPRCRDATLLKALLARFPNLSAQVQRSGHLADLVAAADCVLSCASSAGIEAAAMGAKVIQLLPRGSGKMLPGDEWGFVGTARSRQELDRLLAAALEGPTRMDRDDRDREQSDLRRPSLATHQTA